MMSKQQALGKWIQSASSPTTGKRTRDDVVSTVSKLPKVSSSSLSVPQLAELAMQWRKLQNSNALAGLSSGGISKTAVRNYAHKQPSPSDTIEVEAFDEGFILPRASFDQVASEIVQIMIGRQDWEISVQGRYICDAYLGDKVESISSMDELYAEQRKCLAVLNSLRRDLVPLVVASQPAPASSPPPSTAMEPEMCSPGNTPKTNKTLEPEQEEGEENMEGVHDDAKRYVRLSAVLVDYLRSLQTEGQPDETQTQTKSSKPAEEKEN